MLVLCSHDDEQIARWRAGLEGHPGRYRRYRSLQALAEDKTIGTDDLVLLDMELETDHPGRLLDFISAHPEKPVFAFSARHRPEEGAEVIAAGARGYANRYMHPKILAQAVSLVENGEIWLGADLVLHLIRQSAPVAAHDASTDRSTGDDALWRGFTRRERDIARRIVQGKSNKVIANELGIAERTVKAHLGSIYRKTGTRDRLQLAMLLKDRC